jgi:hypothetical protein
MKKMLSHESSRMATAQWTVSGHMVHWNETPTRNKWAAGVFERGFLLAHVPPITTDPTADA